MMDPIEDPIRYAAEVVGRDPFATLLGIKVEEARDSYARVSLIIKEEYCNAATRTHGGVLFTLADQALAVAANTIGRKSLAMEVKINYFQATSAGEKIVAAATPVDIRNRVSLWNVDLTNEKGERVAVAHGLAYHLVD